MMLCYIVIDGLMEGAVVKGRARDEPLMCSASLRNSAEVICGCFGRPGEQPCTQCN